MPESCTPNRQFQSAVETDLTVWTGLSIVNPFFVFGGGVNLHPNLASRYADLFAQLAPNPRSLFSGPHNRLQLAPAIYDRSVEIQHSTARWFTAGFGARAWYTTQLNPIRVTHFMHIFS
jgi:hypothetical protein